MWRALEFSRVVFRSHTITATYGGDTTHDGSSGTTGVTASKHSTATGLVCDPSVPVGSAASCTATVTDSVATAPFTSEVHTSVLQSRPPLFSSLSLASNGVTQRCSVSYTPTT